VAPKEVDIYRLKHARGVSKAPQRQLDCVEARKKEQEDPFLPVESTRCMKSVRSQSSTQGKRRRTVARGYSSLPTLPVQLTAATTFTADLNTVTIWSQPTSRTQKDMGDNAKLAVQASLAAPEAPIKHTQDGGSISTSNGSGRSYSCTFVRNLVLDEANRLEELMSLH